MSAGVGQRKRDFLRAHKRDHLWPLVAQALRANGASQSAQIGQTIRLQGKAGETRAFGGGPDQPDIGCILAVQRGQCQQKIQTVVMGCYHIGAGGGGLGGSLLLAKVSGGLQRRRALGPAPSLGCLQARSDRVAWPERAPKRGQHGLRQESGNGRQVFCVERSQAPMHGPHHPEVPARSTIRSTAALPDFPAPRAGQAWRFRCGLPASGEPAPRRGYSACPPPIVPAWAVASQAICAANPRAGRTHDLRYPHMNPRSLVFLSVIARICRSVQRMPLHCQYSTVSGGGGCISLGHSL